MVCPVCTVAVGVGVGALRIWGVDDLITGIWFGALILSSIIWMLNFFERKNITFLFKKILVIVSFYAIFIVPLYYMGVMGAAANQIFGMDKLLFGVIIGSIIFLAAVWSNHYLKRINEGKVLIYYQRVIIPLVYLALASIIIYILLLIV